MKNIQLQRMLQVMRRTGDKAMVADMHSDEVFVMMNLDKYEDLLDDVDFGGPENGGRDDDDSDNDNDDSDDSNSWGEFDDNALDVDFAPHTREEESEPPTEEIVSEPAELTGPATFSSFSAQPQPPFSAPLDFSSDWVNNNSRPIFSEENLDDIPHEEEEEKFYLEPIE